MKQRFTHQSLKRFKERTRNPFEYLVAKAKQSNFFDSKSHSYSLLQDFWITRIQSVYRMHAQLKVYACKKKACLQLQHAYRRCDKQVFCLRKSNKRYKALLQRFVIGGSIRCPITLEEPIRGDIAYFNGHLYSASAVKEWIRMRGTCPLTRAKAEEKDVCSLLGIHTYIQQLKTQLDDAKDSQYKLQCQLETSLQSQKKLLHFYNNIWRPTTMGGGTYVRVNNQILNRF